MEELTAVEVRILGCLVEKAATTPDAYPLTTNALVAACNQRTNRDPVVDYSERLVDATMLELRLKKLARTIAGGRANKHRHILDEALGLDAPALAVLAVLTLRGPQTSAELRARTERLWSFETQEEVDGILQGFAARAEPLAVLLERRPGQKERRWAHLLCGAPDDADLECADALVDRPVAASPPVVDADVGALEEEIRALRRDVDRLYELLGESPPSADGDA